MNSLVQMKMWEVLSEVNFIQHPTLSIKVGVDSLASAGQGLAGEDQPWLQLIDHALPKEFQSGRKWRLSQYMTESEVVGTAFAAYEQWLKHEMFESFTYKGVAIFNPHVSVEARVRMASDPANYEYRS